MKSLIILLFATLPSFGSDIDSLNQALDSKASYDAQYERRIDSIRSKGDPKALYQAYNSYCYDSAFYYVQEVVRRAEESGDDNAITSAKIKQAYVYISGGRFHECDRLFEDIERRGLPNKYLTGYYSLRGHLLYDVARYQGTPYAPMMRDYYELALEHVYPTDSGSYWNISAQLALIDGKSDEAIRCFNEAYRMCGGHLHSEAIFLSSIAQVYFDRGDSTQALHYWIQAAVRDIRSSTKEVVAMQQVAQLLHAMGDYDMADRCIRSALDDACHFHARHRQLEVGEIIPIIDSWLLDQMRQRNLRERALYTCIVCLLLLGGLALMLVLRKLRARNRSLVQAQEHIRLTNVALAQSNHVKETYLTAMLSAEADHTEAEERYVKFVTRAVRDKRYDDLLTTPAYISRLGQRTAFYHRFDSMFLHLYPHFIDDVNRYLNEPYEAKQGALPGELRVFALMRLGVDDNEQMAHILSSSIATIHTYKARVFARLCVPKDDFLRAVSADGKE